MTAIVLEKLHQANANEELLPSAYDHFCKTLRCCVGHLGLKPTQIALYARRHSGPTIDRARSDSSVEEIRKRLAQYRYVSRCERPRGCLHLGDAVLGRQHSIGSFGADARETQCSWIKPAEPFAPCLSAACLLELHLRSEPETCFPSPVP